MSKKFVMRSPLNQNAFFLEFLEKKEFQKYEKEEFEEIYFHNKSSYQNMFH